MKMTDDQQAPASRNEVEYWLCSNKCAQVVPRSGGAGTLRLKSGTRIQVDSIEMGALFESGWVFNDGFLTHPNIPNAGL